MNQDTFINRIITEVHNSSVDDICESLLERPPGRSPDRASVALHEWYLNLNENDREKILQIIRQSVHSSIFGFLAVLDGARVIEDGDKKGEFELIYKNIDGKHNLSSSKDLHNIYQAEIYDVAFKSNT
jgi:hypothetical protein